MNITIDIDSEEPLFAQVVEQVKGAVRAQALKPGNALPSIRQLAGDLGLNNKTVAKAYRLLERDNVIVTRGYRGTFIHDDAEQHCSFDLAGWTRSQLATAIEACRKAGATDSEIRIAFASAMQE
ncbi:GntR family transcriptional regulator [Kordiimonas lipolytica]|uniref:GntR family transcriptional regulator n=1 Tax=Kordiimonas lipolytica TaxID=1662421 RepID=A0ABV8UEL0_9PROT|nr:GntR family transcriptional regulator [Kordiimonas lipolytica]